MATPTDLARLAVATAATVSLALATGCGATDDADTLTTVSDDPSVPISSAPAVTRAPDTTAAPDPATSSSTSTPTATSAPTAASSTTTTQTETPPTGDSELPIPAGSFETDPTDLFVLVRSGDLEVWSGALAPTPPQRTLVADYPDPFAVSADVPGPNVIDHVAGAIVGSVVFGDCCEPISGNVVAATDVGEAAPIAGGSTPTLSPTRDLLGTANANVITQSAADSTGAGRYRQLDQQQSLLNVTDLTWSSNATDAADDDHLVLLAWDDDGWWLHDVDRTTLEPTPTLDLGVPSVLEAPDTTMDFVGHGPNSEIVVAQGTSDTTRLRYFEPATLAELVPLERSLPGSASSIRLADDGLGLLWVDDGSLYHLPAGEVGAVRLGTDILAAWFA